MKRKQKIKLLSSNAIEKICLVSFCFQVNVSKIIINMVPVDNDTFTTIFMNNKNEIFALCTSSKNLTLSDIKDVNRKMGIKAEHFFPPFGNEMYFLNYAKESFKAVFPGRKQISEQDLSFYKSFSPYSPALMKISKISGEIKSYDMVWHKWIGIIGFSYNKVKVNEQ